MFEELHSSSVSFLQKYDLVREEQNKIKYFFIRTEKTARAKEILLSFGRVD